MKFYNVIFMGPNSVRVIGYTSCIRKVVVLLENVAMVIHERGRKYLKNKFCMLYDVKHAKTQSVLVDVSFNLNE